MLDIFAIEKALPGEMTFEHTNTENTRREAWVIKPNGKIRPRDRAIEDGALKYYWQQLMPSEIVVCKKPHTSAAFLNVSIRSSAGSN